jgi:hypothetical protein
LGFDSFFTSGRIIVDITKVKTRREKLNTLGELLGEVMKLIGPVLITSRLDDFIEFTEKYIETEEILAKAESTQS